MELIKRDGGGGAAESNAGTLGGENCCVEVFLGLGEPAGYGPGAGNVGDVAAILLS